MASLDFIRQLRSMGFDEKNLSSSDLAKLFAMSVKGEFDKEVFKDFLRESNITFTKLMDGLDNFANIHKFSSDEYVLTLKMLITDLKEEAKNATTPEEKEQCFNKVLVLLDRFEKEVDNNREHGKNLALAATGAAVMVAGAAMFLVTRNPEVLKKGTAMIVKHGFK